MREVKKVHKSCLILVILFTLIACGESYQPKPRGYFRIDFPEHQYELYQGNCPFSFNYSSHAVIKEKGHDCWMDIYYPSLQGSIHLGYHELDGNLNKYLEDSRKLAYKHTVKAADINEKLFVNEEEEVYGLIYEFEGSTATSAQFYLTDSTDHFLRGALYFEARPNPDSLRPAEEYVIEDIRHFMETFRWKGE